MVAPTWEALKRREAVLAVLRDSRAAAVEDDRARLDFEIETMAGNLAADRRRLETLEEQTRWPEF